MTPATHIGTYLGRHTAARSLLLAQVAELDFNNDGKPDVIDFRATVAGGSPVHGVKALLQFQYSLTVGLCGVRCGDAAVRGVCTMRQPRA